MSFEWLQSRFPKSKLIMVNADSPAFARYSHASIQGLPCLYRAATPGSSMTIRFKGTHLGLKGFTGPDSGVISIQVDDQPARMETQFTVYSGRYGYGGRPLPAMANGVHRVTWTLLDEKPDKQKILAAYNRRGNDQGILAHPETFAEQALCADQILLVGEILPPEGK